MKFPLFLALLASAPALSAAAPKAAPPVQAAAQAAPPSVERQTLARRYVSLSLTPERLMESFRDQSAAMMEVELEGDADKGRHAEAEKSLQRLFDLLEPKIRERLPNLLEAYSMAFAREFSADELRQMIDFAQSPAGQHYLSRRPALETDRAVEIQLEGFQLDAAQVLQQIEKEQCQERTAQRIAAGDKNAKCPLSTAPETQAG